MGSDISALISSADFWEKAGYIATAVVLLGVAGESVCQLTRWINPEATKRRIEIVSALLLLAGLAGEILTQVQSNEANSLAVAFLNKEAGDAEQVADTAIKQANTAIAQAKEITKVQTALDADQTQLAQISDKERELEKRQSDLLDTLTPPQLEYGKFSTDLAGISPIPIVIEAEPDPNSQFFAADLNAAFRQAKWSQRSIVNERTSFIPGIWVKYLYSYPHDETVRKAARAVCLALNAQLLTKARVISAMTLEAQHERFRRLNLSEDVWLWQHGNGPDALDWPESAPSGAVVVHVGRNPNDFFFNNERIKKGLPPMTTALGDPRPPCEP